MRRVKQYHRLNLLGLSKLSVLLGLAALLPGATTAGQDTIPGTLCPPSHTSRLRPLNGPALPAPAIAGLLTVPAGICPVSFEPHRPAKLFK